MASHPLPYQELCDRCYSEDHGGTPWLDEPPADPADGEFDREEPPAVPSNSRASGLALKPSSDGLIEVATTAPSAIGTADSYPLRHPSRRAIERPEARSTSPPSTVTRPRSSARAASKYHPLGLIFLLSGLLLSGFCFYQGLTVPRLDSKPIEQFRLAERMAGCNPLLSDDQRSIPAPDPEPWREVVLRMDKPQGDRIDMELLVPPGWFDAHRPGPGGIVELGLFQLGAVGPADVLSVGPCPPIPPGPVITGRFIHRAAQTIDLHLEGGETIGVTPNHPIWSADQQDYVPAGELRIGEHLLARDGRPVPITSITPRGGPETVYNLQVHGEHVYQVGKSGILVHNNKALEHTGRRTSGQLGEAFHYTQSQWADAIRREGLRPGSYATPSGNLGSLQAKLELALPPTKAAPDVRIRIDLDGLRKAGYEIPTPSRVSSTVVGPDGRVYQMPGDGWEMQFPYEIPAQFLEVIPLK